MKVVILAGGYGTRLSEETIVRPKPMVEIGNQPLLWHIMNIYGAFGHNEFIVALGYKGEAIKEYFLNYYHHHNDLSIQLKTGEVRVTNTQVTDWTIHLVDSGLHTQTGGRLARLRSLLEGETFMLTYGDGLGEINVDELLEFHRSHGRIATVTAVRPVARFGEINLEGDRVVKFQEKPQTGEGWINGGFFVFGPGIFDYLGGDESVLEGAPLENLAKDDQLMAYRHYGFWQCMDTVRDKQLLEKLWASGEAPWTTAGRRSHRHARRRG